MKLRMADRVQDRVFTSLEGAVRDYVQSNDGSIEWFPFERVKYDIAREVIEGLRDGQVRYLATRFDLSGYFAEYWSDQQKSIHAKRFALMNEAREWIETDYSWMRSDPENMSMVVYERPDIVVRGMEE